MPASQSVPLSNWGRIRVRKGAGAADANGEGAAAVSFVTVPQYNEPISAFSEKSRFEIPFSSVMAATGTTKNDVGLKLFPKASLATVKGVEVELQSIRFAVPDNCIGYEQAVGGDSDDEEDDVPSGKKILTEMQEVQRAYAAAHSSKAGDKNESIVKMAVGGVQQSDETIIASFEDIALSQPPGKFKFIITDHNVIMEDHRKNRGTPITSFPLSTIDNMYLCNIPVSTGDGNETESRTYSAQATAGEERDQYLVIALKKPLLLRTAAHMTLVLPCPAQLILDEEHPWKCELKTQEEINALIGDEKDGESFLVQPVLSGKVSEILIRLFKGIAKVKTFGGFNPEFPPVIGCFSGDSQGYLYVLKKCLLFVPKPSLRITYETLSVVEVEVSGEGKFRSMTVTLHYTPFIDGKKQKLSKASLTYIRMQHKDALIKYLKGKGVTVREVGKNAGSDDDASDDEEDEDEEDDSDETASSKGGADSEDDDASAGDEEKSEGRKHKKHKEHKSNKKHDKHDKHGKHKHKPKHRKHKRDREENDGGDRAERKSKKHRD